MQDNKLFSIYFFSGDIGSCNSSSTCGVNKEKDKEDHGYIKKTRRHIQDTKTLDCQPRIRLRIIVKSPQFKVDNYEDKWGRKQSSLNLKAQIIDDLNIEKQLQLHLLLPDRNGHQNHLLDEQRKHYRHLLKPGISTECTPIFEISCKCCVVNNPEYKFLRRQFPIRLSAAKTIHKSQGSTLETVAVYFGSRRNQHMHLVGISRAKNMSGLNILALNEEKLAVSPEVIFEMERMREDAQLSLSEYHKQ
ncbi:unnamed protein product [Mytilus edulis]|uniref:ATP-dependent DNA helicase n=1 Tax=Mytilus edulis TaxID=6550 RepID=A0A8S3S5E0_MYTED|nr:unnamed protein product [Mytilus edulis]